MDYSETSVGFILICTSLALLMIPGLGYFYSGLLQSKNALSLILLSFISLAVISIEWYAIGYSMVFGKSSSTFIGNLDHVFLLGLDKNVKVGELPEIVFIVFQNMFASIVPAVVIGAAAERCRTVPTVVFMIVWSIFVYNFVAYWTWNVNGWAQLSGELDFAGGTPVHITSGFSALVLAIYVGKRNCDIQELKPHNISHILLGTGILWFGWLGFNGGSTLTPNIVSGYAIFNTNLCASIAGIVWLLMDYFMLERKFNVVSFCSGVLSGLVVITPAAGLVDMHSCIVFGILGAVVCNLAIKFKELMGFDDVVDVFAVHGVGGVLGSLLTGVFARKEMALLNNLTVDGGVVDGNWMQLVHQFVGALAAAAWSVVITLVIVFIIDHIPGLQFRLDEESELVGLDLAELGSHAYSTLFDKEVSAPSTSKTTNKLNEKMQLETLENYIVA